MNDDRLAMTAPSSSVTRSTKPRSTVPSLRAGVPTDTRTTSASAAEAARSDDTRSRPDSTPVAISSSSPGSTIGLTPRSSGSSLCGSTSTPTTLCPSFDRQAAVTAPTYPRPTTTTFIREVSPPVAKAATTRFRQVKVPEMHCRERRDGSRLERSCPLRPCVQRADGYDKPGDSSRSAVTWQLPSVKVGGKRDRHRPVCGRSSAPPHDRVRRRRADDRAGRVVRSLGYPRRGSPTARPRSGRTRRRSCSRRRGHPSCVRCFRPRPRAAARRSRTRVGSQG